jgi:hypothetical protein
MRRTGGLERAVNAVSQIYPDHAVLVVIDSDDDCPKELGPALLQRATSVRPDLLVSVVLAHREYEAWFVAAAESLRARRGIREDVTAPAKPEEIRDAKGWLSKQMPPAQRYSPTQDQVAFSSLFDLELAKSRSRSFRKLCKEVEEILRLTQFNLD